MAKYIYPAIFTPEANGQFSIYFPDIENCFTCGDNLEDGISMAEDVLSLTLTHLEDNGRKILTIPSWLNDSATAAGINFSQVLQDALKQQLNVT